MIRQLSQEHEEIGGILTSLDAALADMMEDPGKLAGARERAEELSALLLSHLDDEEEELLEPLGRLDIALTHGEGRPGAPGPSIEVAVLAEAAGPALHAWFSAFPRPS